MMGNLKTLKDLNRAYHPINQTDLGAFYNEDELKAEAVTEIKNTENLVEVLFNQDGFLKRRLTADEIDILQRYIKWKNNLTEEDLKERDYYEEADHLSNYPNEEDLK